MGLLFCLGYISSLAPPNPLKSRGIELSGAEIGYGASGGRSVTHPSYECHSVLQWCPPSVHPSKRPTQSMLLEALNDSLAREMQA